MSYQELPTNDEMHACDDLWGVGEFLSGLEVKEASIADWLRATVGAHMDVRHVMGEKVVSLRAAPEACWSIA